MLNVDTNKSHDIKKVACWHNVQYLASRGLWTPLQLTSVPSSSFPPLLLKTSWSYSVLSLSSPPLVLNTSWSYHCSFIIFSSIACIIFSSITSEHLLILPLFLRPLLLHCFWTPLDLTSVPSSSSPPLLLNTSWSYLCSFIIFSITTSEQLLILPLFLHYLLHHYFWTPLDLISVLHLVLLHFF